MKQQAFFFLFLMLLCVAIQGFFSMFEMACVSFNKVRLHFYESKKHKRALWMKFLLSQPSRLFGTTLIAINLAMQIGSEASRRFYESVGFDPDLAPITQVLIVLIFGELAPLFAARRHPESIALLSTPVVYGLSKVFSPFIWMIEGISRMVQKVLGKTSSSHLFLSREEIQRAFEDSDQKNIHSESEGTATVIGNIFSLKNKTAKQIMIGIETYPPVFFQKTFEQVRTLFKVEYPLFIPLYKDSLDQIVSIVDPKNCVRAKKAEKLLDFGRSPWFITETSSILQILKQFRRNSRTIAVVLDEFGKGIGYVTLDKIIDEILGKHLSLKKEEFLEEQEPIIEKTVSGDFLLSDFNRLYGTKLFYKDAATFSELVSDILQHPPSLGEIIYIDSFVIEVLDVSLLKAKTVSIKTVI